MHNAIKEMLADKLAVDEVKALNNLLTAEYSALEAYEEAIQKVNNVKLIPALVHCRESHAQNVLCIRAHIEKLGGTPVTGAGLIGGLTKLVEDGASLFGDEAAIAVVVGAEDFCLKEYATNMNALSPESWDLMKDEPFTEHKKTHKAIYKLYLKLCGSGKELVFINALSVWF